MFHLVFHNSRPCKCVDANFHNSQNNQRRHLRGLGGAVAPPPPPPRKQKKRKKKKKEKKREKREKRKKGTMNNVKLLHIKCCFFQFFNSPVALKNKKKFLAPQENVEMTPLKIMTTIGHVMAS